MKITLTCRADKAAQSYGRRRGYLSATASTDGGHFAVTAKLYSPGHDASPFAMGQLHDETRQVFPELIPLIALHLCDVITGEPMHAEANAFYWVNGALSLGAPYPPHQTPEDCAAFLALHLRIPILECYGMLEGAKLLQGETLEEGGEVVPVVRAYVEDYVDQQRQRWASEAAAGLELLKTLQP